MEQTTLRTVDLDGQELAYFEAGSGPLAICAHGYPDSPHTWRHLVPELVTAGYRVIAPFLRGYSPSGLAADGCYLPGAAAGDLNRLHAALDGDDDAVLIGHDWGALVAYAAAGLDAERWRRIVTMAVPPGPAAMAGFLAPEQLKRSWYIFFQLWPHADGMVMADDWAYIASLWNDWSPGYDATNDVARFVETMATPEHLSAALGYYRQTLDLTNQPPEWAMAQLAMMSVPTQPLLYLHGVDDGCMGISIADAVPESLTVESSRYERISGAGHFLHLERPQVINPLIVDFITGR